MTEQQHPAQGDWAEWWPGGHQRWIKQAMSIEQLVEAAFLAGWDARNSRLTAMARTPGDTGMRVAYPGPIPAPGEQSPGWRQHMPQRIPGQWMPQSGPPPVMKLADYPNLAALTRIKQRIEAITPAPGQPEVPDPAETRDLPAIRDDDSTLDATFERLGAAWTEEYGPVNHLEDGNG